MENYTIVTERGGEFTNTTESHNLLHEISKWTKFLSIIGFIFIGLMVLTILFSGIMINSVNQYMLQNDIYPYNPGVFHWGYAIMSLLIIGIYFLPIYYLFKFSTRTNQAIKNNNPTAFTQAFRFLRNHYLIIGILTIVSLILFVISLFFVIIGVMCLN